MHTQRNHRVGRITAGGTVAGVAAALLLAAPASAAIPGVASEYWGDCPALSSTTSSNTPYSVSPGPADDNWPVPTDTYQGWTGAGPSETSVHADATTLALGSYERAAHDYGSADTWCQLHSHITNSLTVGPGSSGLAVGDPVTVILTTNLGGGLGGWGSTSRSYSTSASMSAKFTVKDGFTTLASYTADGYADVSGQANVQSANVDGKYDVYLYGNNSGTHNETPAEQQWSMGAGASPYAPNDVIDLTSSVGTRTITFDTTVGAVLTLDGSVRSDEMANYGDSAGIVRLDPGFTGGFAAAPASSGISLTLASDTTDLPTYTQVDNLTLFYGQAVSLNSDVTSDSGVPSGSVDYVIDGAPAGSAALDANGRARLPLNATTPYLSVGYHPVTTTYTGGPGYLSSTSPLSGITVLKASTGTSLAVNPVPVTPNKPVTLTATVVTIHGQGVPTGSVTFTDGAIVLGTAGLNGSGVATLVVNGKNLVGNHKLTATYNGDSTHATSVMQRTIPTTK